MNDDSRRTDEAVRINRIKDSQDSLDKEMMAMESILDELIRESEAVNSRLHQAKSEKPLKKEGAMPAVTTEAAIITPPQSEVVAPKAPASIGDINFKGDLEKLLQGSMDHLEDRLSQRILNMLKELKVASGPAREMKFREVQEAVSSESVDLSSLFKHEKIESNIADIGIEEKESQSIQSNLERLKKMRQGGSAPDTKK